jgi:single-strand DNA-binding protein
MARSLNTITLIGNVGQQPETFGEGDKGGARFSVATSPSWKPEATEWHRVICWRKLAEIVGRYVNKGDKVCVIGRMTYNEWTDKAGVTRTTAEILADEVLMLGSPPSGGSGNAPTSTTMDPEADKKLPF